jgi:hypothetical protein
MVDANVTKLASDSGALRGVTGPPAEHGRFSVLAFEFAAGTLVLRCDDDTDEVIVEVVDNPPPYKAVTDKALVSLIGMSIEYAWALTNHRGYTDAFQLRLIDTHRREETRQFEVAASALDVLTVLR